MTAVVGIVAVAVVALHLWTSGFYGSSWKPWSSPDAENYLQAGRGQPTPQPYHRRWLLPYLLSDKVIGWSIISWTSLVLTAVALEQYVGGTRGVYAALLFLALPLVRVNTCLPVLTDAPTFLLALLSGWAWQTGHAAISLALALVAGACKETGPVFAALLAWHPAPLLGLLAVRWWGGAEPSAPWLHKSILESFRYFRGRDLFAWEMVAPWGATLPLAITVVEPGTPRIQLLTTLGVGYGQLLIAADCARLYQWAAVPVLVAAVHAPLAWLPVAVLVTAYSGYKGV